MVRMRALDLFKGRHFDRGRLGVQPERDGRTIFYTQSDPESVKQESRKATASTVAFPFSAR
jgi:hypothetical protein